MSQVVDFTHVSTEDLESSPVADALAGRRANEARYFNNTYDHIFTVDDAADVPESKLAGTIRGSYFVIKGDYPV